MADRPICIGVKTSGHRCDKQAVVGDQRCRTHLNTVRDNGPNATAIKELTYTHKRLIRELEVRWDQRINAERDPERQNEMMEDMATEKNMLKVQQRNELNLLRRTQQEQIRQTGINPDADAERRREQERQRRQAEWDANGGRAQFLADIAARQRNWEEQNRVIAQQQQARAPVGELARFAGDNQNVHTTQSVNMTKEMVARLLKIQVPEEYRWNTQICSKTPGDIIMSCKLTPKAAWQMSAKYCQDEDIYELGKGIYGKVLDAVWQYTLNSSDKADICRCLKQEMEDNIGMCAQGNLSRLCNILAGYMEGIGSQESPTEVLGRKLPKLMEISDVTDRLKQAFNLLKELNIPFPEWKQWVEPLLLDQEQEMTIGFLQNRNDEIIGIVAILD